MKDQIVVGEIEGYPVLYNPSKRHVFCKNTTINVDVIFRIMNSNTAHHRIESSKLSVFKFENTVNFGCLTTTQENVKNILKKIKKL